MSAVVDIVERQGPALLAGATVLLAVGALGGMVARGAIHRQRIGELTVLGVLVWAVLACVPLRRPGMEWVRRGELAVGWQEVRANRAVVEERVWEEGVGGAAPPLGPSLSRGGATEAWLAVAASLEDTLEGDAWGEPFAIGEGAARGASDDDASGLARAGASRAIAIDWKRFAATTYMVGAAVALVWLHLGWVLVWRLVRSGATPRPWLEELYGSLPFAGRRRRPRLLVSWRCRQAFSWGIWRPTVVLPAEGCRPGRREQVRHVLLHELGHAAQRDAWGNFVLNLALPVLYAHPLYWWLRRQVRNARELIADDWAARRSTKEAYAEELLGLVKARGRFGLSYLSVMGMSARRSQFYRRMEMLLQREGRLSTRCSGAWRWLMVPAWALVVAVMVAGVGAERSIAQESEVETEARLEQPEEPERASEVEEGGASAEAKELKAVLAALRAEREALRAELDELRKRTAELQAKLESRQRGAIEQRVRELEKEDVGEVTLNQAIRAAQRYLEAHQGKGGPEARKRLEAEARNVYRLQEEDVGTYYEKAKKQAAAAKEQEANARQQVEEAYRARVDQQRAKAAQEEAAAREDVETAREHIKRYQDLERQDAEQFRNALDWYRQAQKAAGDEANKRNAYFQRAFEAQTRVGAVLGQGRGGAQSDLDALIRLATQYVTAQSEIPEAESRLRKMQAANEGVENTFPATEVDVAAIGLETAERKVELFRQIAEAVSEAVKVELSLASRAVEEGELSDAERLAARSRMAQAEAKLKILQLVLD